METLLTDNLLAEYENIVGELSDEPTEEEIIGALVAKGDWTHEGARAILKLARTYGTAILRNALALADALGIEDGDSGL
jgi:hypothetical protein